VTQTIINFLNQKNFPFFDNIFAFDLFLWMLLDYQDKKNTKIIFSNENTFRKTVVICFFRFRLFCVKTNTMLQKKSKETNDDRLSKCIFIAKDNLGIFFILIIK
jgi:hypothetical protein